MHLESEMMTQTVRSGQRIYARHKNLVVWASVSPGAEILADGDIHIYGKLRGRALAGADGNTKARLFCQHLEAELIAIGGIYQLNEQFISSIDPGMPTQVYLDEKQNLRLVQ